MTTPTRTALLCVIALTAQSLSAQTQWAGVVTLPAGFQPTDGTLITHSYDEGDFIVGTSDTTKRGGYKSGYLTRIPEGFHEPSDAAWKKWEPVLRGQGWSLKGHRDDNYTLQRLQGANESWLTVNLAEFQDPKLTLVQLGASPRKLDLAPPASTPERVGNTQEWPYLKAVPGATLEGTATNQVPFDVTIPGVDQEPHLVGSSHLTKTYTPPASLSKIEFELTYRDALQRAGWTVIPRAPGVSDAEGVVLAHYAASGRDIWVSLGRAADDSNTGMSFSVADIGAEDWARQLAGACRLPLYGVMFDFDKTTLKAESTPALTKAAAALTADATLSIEVQGHTDDVGDDAYNLRLSGQRAEAVRVWLTGHGIAATRLTSKGYGKTQPIVENSSDVNRARNRRVELTCRK